MARMGFPPVAPRSVDSEFYSLIAKYLGLSRKLYCLHLAMATMLSIASRAAIVLGWQFRPVLGADYVKGGQRQVFAQLALPADLNEEYVPTVYVQTRWRACEGTAQRAAVGLPKNLPIDLNSLIPPNSPLQLTVASFISDLGEIVGGGDPIGCSNNDSCNHVYVLIPCDENHPDIEGCDYSLVESVAKVQTGALLSTAPRTSELSPAQAEATPLMRMLNRRQRFGVRLPQ